MFISVYILWVLFLHLFLFRKLFSKSFCFILDVINCQARKLLDIFVLNILDLFILNRKVCCWSLLKLYILSKSLPKLINKME